MVVICFGDIIVICFVIVEDFVLFFLREIGIGWVIVEYSMLFWVMSMRNCRESSKGKFFGRIMEI